MNVLIIGAGPAGMAAAYTLRDQGFTGTIHLIEQGRRLAHRICPVDRGRVCHGCGGTCNVLSGFGGCIHYGDAVKLSLLPAGRRLISTLGEEAHTRLDEAVRIIEQTLGETISFCNVSYQPDPADNFSFKPYPVGLLSAAQVRQFLQSLYERLECAPNVNLLTETKVLDIEASPQGGWRVTLQTHHRDVQVLHADQVIMAGGRAGMFWWRKKLRELGLAFQHPQPSVGLRFEVNQRWLAPAGDVHPDYKVTMRHSSGKFKSFCYCAGTGGGQIKYTDYGDFCLLDGHVMTALDAVPDDQAPGNFALLYQIPSLPPEQDPLPFIMERYVEPYKALRPAAPGKPVAQRLTDFRNRREGASTWAEMRAGLKHRPSVEDLTPARVDSLFGDAEHAGFCQAVERYMEAVLGHHNAGSPEALDEMLVVALELEGLWDVLEVDMHLESSHPGLFVTGDALGIAQGILQAMATGIAAGRRIASLNRLDLQQSSRDRLVYDRYWTVGEHYQPSDTFVQMVDQLMSAQGREVSIADLGCGIGRHALYAASRGAQVTAIDHSGRAISKLISRAGELPIQVVEDDFSTWLCEGLRADLDGLVCFDAIHHISSDEEQIVATLREMVRRVRPQGFVLVTLLTDIDYGVGGGPPGRFLISADEAERLLDRVFDGAHVVQSKRSNVRFENTVNYDPAAGRMVETYYQATRVIRLFQLAGDPCEVTLSESTTAAPLF